MRISLCKSVDIKKGRVERASGVEFFQLQEGRVDKIGFGLGRIAVIPNVFSFQLRLKEGSIVNRITSSLNRYGEVIVSGETPNDVNNTINTVVGLVNRYVTIE